MNGMITFKLKRKAANASANEEMFQICTENN